MHNLFNPGHVFDVGVHVVFHNLATTPTTHQRGLLATNPNDDSLVAKERAFSIKWLYFPNLRGLHYEKRYDHTMSRNTPMTMRITAYQWLTKNHRKDLRLPSEKRSFRRVANGPDGST